MTAGCPNRQWRHTPSSWTTPNPDTTLLGLYFQQRARRVHDDRSRQLSLHPLPGTDLSSHSSTAGECAPCSSLPPTSLKSSAASPVSSSNPALPPQSSAPCSPRCCETRR